MKQIEEYIQKRLFEMQDGEYKTFHQKLIPTVAPETLIGVRTPLLRSFAKEIEKHPEIDDFINTLPHQYYDENNLHGFLVERIKDFEHCLSEINRFLPYVDNWATCDLMSPAVFKKHRSEVLAQIGIWISSDHTYTIRFGLKMLMSLFLDDAFQPEYLKMAAGILSSEYYVNMMIAWFFATALAKQYKETVSYIEEYRLSPSVHNQTIKKACESLRITDEQKRYLKNFKVKLSDNRNMNYVR